MRKNRGLATIQILILIVATVAFSYALGDEIKVVSAAPTKCEDCNSLAGCSPDDCSRIKSITGKNCVYFPQSNDRTGVNCVEITSSTSCSMCGNFPGEVACDKTQCDLIKTNSGKNCVFKGGTFNSSCTESSASTQTTTNTPAQNTQTNTNTNTQQQTSPQNSQIKTSTAEALIPAAGAILGASGSLNGALQKVGLKQPSVATLPTSSGGNSAQSLNSISSSEPPLDYNTYTYKGAKFFKANDGTWYEWNKDYPDGVKAVTSGDTTSQLNKLNPDGTPKAPGPGFTHYVGKIFGNALEALAIYGAIKLLGPLLIKDQNAVNSLSLAAGIGYFVASTASDVGLSQVIANAIGISTGLATFGIGVIVAGVIFVLSYKKTDEQKISFTCDPWQAPLGGSKCEECNKKGDIPCTEYQCKSLGQGCEIINKGTSEELCIWNNSKDISPPTIRPWVDALPSKQYSYTPDGRISPPDKGVYIQYNGNCIPYWTPFTFGVEINEPARCKMDVTRKRTYDEMSFPFGGSDLLRYNHTESMSLPSKESLDAENTSLKNGGNYEIYVMCQDANGNPLGNSSSASFVFKYCIDNAPDTTPPKILSIDPPSGEPINYNQSNLSVRLYTNEPSDCKWTYDKDKDYSQMENNMTCSKSATQMNAQMTYTCTTTLTGIKSRQENDFYFRCKDKPLAQEKDRYANSVGEKFVVYGTQPLVIDSVMPNGTIKDSVDLVKVSLTAETSGGYKDGESICYYSESCYKQDGNKTRYIDLIGSDDSYSHTHTEDLRVYQGTYQCSVRCNDRGGNADTKEVTYTVETDTQQPKIIRIFKEETSLKIITDEEGECVYDTVSCNYAFSDGLKMNDYKTEHYTNWEDKTYYIKCKDLYNNQPNQDQCTLVVSPSQIFSIG